MHLPFKSLLVYYWMVNIPNSNIASPVSIRQNTQKPMGRDFNVPNPEGLESVSNWTNLGINSQQASATMKKYN